MIDANTEVVIDSKDIEVIIDKNVSLIDNNIDVKTLEPEYEITINRKEYNVVGDELYIPRRFEDAPTWLQNLITQVIDTSIGSKIQDLNQISQSLESMIEAMEVAKNTYEMSVISSNDIDERINTAVTTLNSNMNESDATILEVAQTRTTPEEAATITIDVISAQLGSTNAGTIGASVSELQTAIANESEARSTSLEVLTSSIEGAFDVSATAINYLNTYVGLDEAGASTGTGLSGYLEGTDGQIGSAGSQLINDISLKAGEVQNKFAYNSTVTLNGVTHNSGFGIATTINSSSIPEGDSQFWVSANEFKVVGANQTADAQGPFTVNTTTGDITFRGKVTFNSGQIGTIDEAIAQVVETVSVGDKNINITDNLIPTTSIVADTNNSGYQFVGAPVKSNASGFSSFAEPQISMILGDETYSLYVDEMTIPYYYRFAIKGLADNADLNKFKIVTIDGSNNVNYATITFATSEALVSTEWYEIDGIINPVGGDTAVASGSIRKSDGTKIGTVNNFAISSGSTKLLLGWYGDCIISRMKLSKITADTLTGNYVTQDYVDNGINNKVSSATTDEIAKKLGYLSYADMVSKAALGQTIINAGYLRTSLIEANSIVANQINTTGLVAENIRSNTIIGNDIYGSKIEGVNIIGARINGSVIKASYLDLDGELEVLTNYHISVAMFNSNPSLYTDAVFVSADNEYRIPSMSMIREPSKAGNNNQALYGAMRSYNIANVGNNLKAVKIRPTFQNLSGAQIAQSRGSVSFKINGITLGTMTTGGSNPSSNGYYADFVFTSNYTTGFSFRQFVGDSFSPTPEELFRTERYVYDLPVFCDLKIECVIYGSYYNGDLDHYGKFTIYLAGGSHTLPFDWTSGQISIHPTDGTARLSGIQINNMI